MPESENFQPDNIARCRAGIMNAMKKVDAALQSKNKPVTAMPLPAPKVAHAPSKPVNQTFMVYFPFDRHKIAPTSKHSFLNAIDAAHSMGARRIAAFSHSDTLGRQAVKRVAGCITVPCGR